MAARKKQQAPKTSGKIDSTSIDKEHFWTLVDSLGWGAGERDYKSMSRRLMLRYTAEGIEELWKIFLELRRTLSAVLLEDEQMYGSYVLSDDRFDDLCSSIIGSGHSFYKKVLANPTLGREHAKLGVVESFAYAFLPDSRLCNGPLATIEGSAAYYRKRLTDEWGELQKDGWENRLVSTAIWQICHVLDLVQRGNYSEALAQQTALSEGVQVMRRLGFLSADDGPNNLLEDLKKIEAALQS